MYKTTFKGRHNIIGLNVKKIRKEKYPDWSQRVLAEKLQLEGMDVGKNRVSDIEAGKSYVTDIEVTIIAKVLEVSTDTLLDKSVYEEAGEYTESETYKELDIAESAED